MQNKKAFKILAFIALFILIIFTWVVVKDAQKKKLQNNPVSTGLDNPFGTSGGENDLGSNENPTSGTSTGSNQVESPAEIPATTVVIVEDNPVLKQLSTVAVAGFTFTSEEREIPEAESITPDANIVEVFDFSGYKTIRFGDKADEVVAIKTVLNRQNPSPGLAVNNDYDTDMKNAVVDFQNRNGLTGDGVIGPKTYAKLNSIQGITTFTSIKKDIQTETVSLVRYVDTASGFVFDKPIRKNEEAVKKSDKSIPGVVEAFFDDTATRIVMRYLKEKIIQTYIARLTFPKIDPNLTKEERDVLPKTATVTGEYLPENIATLSISRDRKNMFYLLPSSSGVVGFTYNLTTKAKKQIFSSPLFEWIADFASTGKINLTTKSAAQVLGYSYSVGNPSGNLSKNIGGELGLTTLMSPDGKKILLSMASNNALSTFVLDVSSGKRTSVSPSTLPEKCVWTKDSKKIYCAAPAQAVSGLFPDDWYKGKMSFDDVLWSIDMRDMNGNIIYDFVSKNGKRLDATNLQLNSSEDYLGFINKKDGLLWGFDLSR